MRQENLTVWQENQHGAIHFGFKPLAFITLNEEERRAIFTKLLNGTYWNKRLQELLDGHA